jgi:hypothetical protein
VRSWRFVLLPAAVLIAAAASTVLTVAVNVATGGTARRFPFIEHHPWLWAAGATLAVAGAGLMVWWTQRLFERRSAPPTTSTEAKPVYGRPVKRWDPMELGVHQVIGGGPMPVYVRRPHDELLEAMLDPAVPASRLVVVRGGSSTGKTRAAYEAVAGRLADWQLDYPMDPDALAARLDAGIPARTVLWLGELRQYADADGGATVLARLADLLGGEGHLVITTMWPEQWNSYTAAARAGRGPAGPDGMAGRLLERLPELTGRDLAGIDPARGGVIDVPVRFTTADLEAAAGAGDPMLAEAAAAAAAAGQGGQGGQGGQVTQYLAGVPDLLRRYAGAGGDPYGQAVITAAMDATRLGHASPLPAALLVEAAVGYLTGPQRTKDIASWRGTALDWAAEELKGAVRALQPVPPPDGTGVAGYQVADYLDQYGCRTRQHQPGPPSLWEALTARTVSATDLTRLAQAAEDRGLYRHAAALWTAAATLGSAGAARQLIAHLRQVSPGDATRAAQWAVSHASLDDPQAIAELLWVLREAGDGDAVTALLARDPVGQARLDDPAAVAWLLGELREAEASDAARALAIQAAGQVSLDDPRAVAWLLWELRAAGASSVVTALAARAAGQVSLDDPQAVALLLEELRAAGADDAARALAIRAAAHARLDDAQAIAELLEELRAAGPDDAARALAIRAVPHARLDDPQAIAELLGELRAAGADDAVTTLLARDLAGQARLDNPWTVTFLLRELHAAGAGDAARALAIRAAAHAPLDHPGAVAFLLRELHEAGAGDAVTTLLARDPVGQARLDNPWTVARLLGALRAAGAGDAARALAIRAAAHARLDGPVDVAGLLRELHAAGPGDAARALAIRAAAHAPLGNPQAIAFLLRELQEAGAGDAVTTLLARDPAVHARLDDSVAVTRLLGALRAAGAGDAVTTLATRAANAGMFERFLEVCPDEAASYRSGREPDGTPSHTWRWQEPTS